MTSIVYPDSTILPGLTWNRERSYVWATGIHEAISGKETRIRYRQYPRVRFVLKYEILRDASLSEIKRLVSFYNAMAGAHETFLFVDPDFNAVSFQQFGTGNSSATAFQLTAQYQNPSGSGSYFTSGSQAEIIQNLNGAPSIYLGSSTTPLTPGVDYNIGPTGVVTFTSAPSATPLKWSGNFYYRCRFEDDEMSVTQFLQNMWNSKDVKLISVKL